MKLKKLFALLLALSLLTGMAAAMEPVEDVPFFSEMTQTVPESNGYVVKLRNDRKRVQLQSDALEPIAHAESYFTVQTIDELKPYLDAGLVESVGANVRAELLDDDPLTNDPEVTKQWYLENLHAPALWGSSFDGSEVKVALIDSGVLDTHEDLAGAYVTGYNFCGELSGGVLQYTDKYQDTNTNGHGTAITGVITARRNNSIGVAGLLERVQVLCLRCFSPNNTAPENVRGNYVDTIISAVGYAMEQGVDVINMSLAVRQEVPTLESKLREAADAGILLVAAAGNYAQSDPNAVVYPACYDFVVSVAATDSNNAVLPTSQKNNQVTVAAPGNSIRSTTNKASGYSSLTGTSLSSPIAAALAAVAKQKDRKIDFDNFDRLLQCSAIDRGDPGKDTSYGWGSIDAATLIDALEAEYPIHYEADGGALPAECLSFYRIAQNTGEALPTPTRGSLDVFDGWYLDAALTKGPYTTLPEGCAGELTFYASWKPAPLTGATVKLVGLEGMDDVTATQDENCVWTAQLPDGTTGAFIAALGSENIEITGVTASVPTRVADDGSKWSFTVDGTSYTLNIPLPKALRLIETWEGTATPASADGTIAAVACRMPVSQWYAGDVASFAKATTDLPSTYGTLGITDDRIMIFTPTAAAAGQTLTVRIYARNAAGLSEPVTATIVVGPQPVPLQMGDVNGDGEVNAKDVTVLRRYLAGGYDATVNEAVSDVNGDGVVNAKDVTTLRRYLAGGYGIEL